MQTYFSINLLSSIRSANISFGRVQWRKILNRTSSDSYLLHPVCYVDTHFHINEDTRYLPLASCPVIGYARLKYHSQTWNFKTDLISITIVCTKKNLKNKVAPAPYLLKVCLKFGRFLLRWENNFVTFQLKCLTPNRNLQIIQAIAVCLLTRYMIIPSENNCFSPFTVQTKIT